MFGGLSLTECSMHREIIQINHRYRLTSERHKHFRNFYVRYFDQITLISLYKLVSIF